MRKKRMLILGIALILSLYTVVFANDENSATLSNAIKLYKIGNYSQCYNVLEGVVKNDPSNPLVYYYLGMVNAQLGRGDEAVINYEKAINLTPKNNNLNRFARKGKRCIETPDKCEESLFDSLEDEFIQNKQGRKFSNEVQSELERLKIENLMREMNRNDAIEPQRFREYKDFSHTPTNDEIVAALRTLQKAGFGNMISNGFSELSVLTDNSQQNSMFNMMNSSSLNPQLIQALFTNSMTQGF